MDLRNSSATAKETWVSTLGSGLYLWDGKKWSCFDANDGLARFPADLRARRRQGRHLAGFAGRHHPCRAQASCWPMRAIRTPPCGGCGSITPTDCRPGNASAAISPPAGGPATACCGFPPAAASSGSGPIWWRSEQYPAARLPAVGPGERSASPAGDRARSPPIPAGRVLSSASSGLSYSAPEKITYRARLAGLDEAWRELGSQRVAAFEAVPPGEYTFEVMAVNGDGVRSAGPRADSGGHRAAISGRPPGFMLRWAG